MGHCTTVPGTASVCASSGKFEKEMDEIDYVLPWYEFPERGLRMFSSKRPIVPGGVVGVGELGSEAPPIVTKSVRCVILAVR